jgi:aspartate-semialdehyde dehydrogenase
MSKLFNVGIVGATGLVGNELVQLLSQQNFPVKQLKLFSGLDDAGERAEFQGEDTLIAPISADFYNDLDLVFFAAHPLVSRDLAESAAQAGVIVIDASRSFRLDKTVPLVVPEVNAATLDAIKKGAKIIASPGPAAIALALALGPINSKYGLKRALTFSIYGSTNEGRLGFEEHQSQTLAIFNNSEFTVEKFPRQTAFNIFPQVGKFITDSTEEEMDIEHELKKVLAAPRLKISATCVQAPVFAGLSTFTCMELKQAPELEELRAFIKTLPGLCLIDNPAEEEYPDVLSSLENSSVLIGRVRKDPLTDSGFQLWMNSDNLRKGSALNMIQIAQEIVKKGLV